MATEPHMCVGPTCWTCGEPTEVREMRLSIMEALAEHASFNSTDSHAIAYLATLAIKADVIEMMTKIVELQSEVYLLARGPLTRVEIDRNVRVHGNQTFSSMENVYGPVAVGQAVQVFEPEAGIAGDAWVSDIDNDKGLVYLRVIWSSLRKREEEK